MKQSQLRFFGLGVALLLLAGCGGTTTTPPAKVVKVGLVTDTGGLNDKSFNHLAYLGLQKGIADLKIKGDVIESKSGDEYVPNLTHFAALNYDLVVGNGFLMPPAMGTV